MPSSNEDDFQPPTEEKAQLIPPGRKPPTAVGAGTPPRPRPPQPPRPPRVPTPPAPAPQPEGPSGLGGFLQSLVDAAIGIADNVANAINDLWQLAQRDS